MTEVAIIGDTHVPSREQSIPEWVRERVRAADCVIHAGDFDSPEAYEAVADLAGERFTAVAGNMDPASLDLPDVAAVDVEGITVAVTHGTAASMDEYEEKVRAAVAEVGGADVAVAGHTHDVTDEDLDGVRLLNPGSATGASPAERATMMTVEVEGDGVRVEVREE